MTNLEHAQAFNKLVNNGEPMSEANYALHHLKTFNKYLAETGISAEALLDGTEKLLNKA